MYILLVMYIYIYMYMYVLSLCTNKYLNIIQTNVLSFWRFFHISTRWGMQTEAREKTLYQPGYKDMQSGGLIIGKPPCGWGSHDFSQGSQNKSETRKVTAPHSRNGDIQCPWLRKQCTQPIYLYQQMVATTKQIYIYIVYWMGFLHMFNLL